MYNILCFGDSNTNGSNPKGGRHPFDKRWPGLLANTLPKDYRIIEEGLGGRTTIFDEPGVPDRNGLKAINMVLATHDPIDLIIIMLGTNDAKYIFNTNARYIAHGAELIIKEVIKHDYKTELKPQILLISPPLIRKEVLTSSFITFDESSIERSKGFSKEFEKIAKLYNIAFLDAAKVVSASETDGLHLDADMHLKLAESIRAIILDILK